MTLIYIIVAVVAMGVVVGLLPDFIRYIKLRSM
jgi:hypothetical protein